MTNILEVRGLYKSFGAIPAVNRLSFAVQPGKIVGLLGPNGCGKSTTMKIAAGLLRGYRGEVLIDGMPVGPQTKAVVSYLPEKSYLNEWMTPAYVVDLFQDFYRDFDKNKALELLNRFELDKKAKLKTMSKGMQEKVQLILVMSRNAKLYMLDEPLSGIDPAARDVMLDLILNNYAEGSSILMSTHLIHDVERIFDSVIILKHGSLLISDTVDNIREREGKSVEDLFREVFKC